MGKDQTMKTEKCNVGCAFAVAMCLSCANVVAHAEYMITDFGAKGDGVFLNTAAIQSAIDTCSRSGGGRVVVPAGTWKTGTIWFRSHVELHLQHGARMLGSENLADYNKDDAYEQNYWELIIHSTLEFETRGTSCRCEAHGECL